MSTTQSVKASLGDDLRRFPLPSSSFTALEEALRSAFSLGTARFAVKYQDDEGDWIVVSSDRELGLALELAKQATLRVTICLDEAAKAGETALSALPAPVSAETAPVSSAETSPSPQWRSKYDMKLEKREIKYEKKLGKFQKKTEELQTKALRHGAARLVADTYPDGTLLAPNQEFVKTWTVRNESLEAWPQTYRLAFQKGHNMSALQSIELPKAVAPGEEFHISAPMRAPSSPGKHVAVWKFIGAFGRPFGQPLRVKIFVGDGRDAKPAFVVPELEAKLRDLASMGFDDRFLNEKLLRKFRGDMDRTVWKLSQKASKAASKAAKWEEKMERKREKLARKM